MSVLAVDIGQSGCRAIVLEGASDTVLARAEGEVDATLAALAGHDVAEVVAGTDGDREELAGSLAARLGVPAAATTRAVLAHAGALRGEPGVALIGDEGAMAIGVDAAGRVTVVDGRGPWLGDEGGSAWIGLAGLRAALGALEGRKAATSLRAAAAGRFGDLSGLARRLGDDAPAAAAAFASDVARAAAHGDAAASAILAAAAAELAATARAAGAGSEPVACAGPLFDLGEPLLAPLREQLAIRLATGRALDGALRLGGPHARHVAHADPPDL